MKNSNKLLIILITLIFSIPLLMVMSFKNAIKENRYVVKNTFGVENAAFKSLKPFKVVKLNSSFQYNLLCNIKSGNKYEYKFVNYNTKLKGKDMPDNCSIDVVGDTLFILYDGKDTDQQTLELDLMVPDGVSLIAEGANINIDETEKSIPKNMLVVLSKRSEIKIGGNYRRNENEDFSEKKIIELSNFSIKSSGSLININPPLKINNLKIEADSSDIFINKNVMIDSLSGTLSPETIINAPYKFVKPLKLR